MKTLTAVFASTTLDRQGDQITKEALEDMARTLDAQYLPMYMHHDPRKPPVGRVIAARVLPADDGFELVGEIEVWEDGDAPNNLKGDGRTIRLRDVSAELCLDYGLYHSPRRDELQGAIGAAMPILYRAKKHADFSNTLLISLGVLTIGSVAGGFLQSLGEDAYNRFKKLLVSWCGDTDAPEAIELLVTVTVDGRAVEVQCFVPEPTPSDALMMLTTGLDQLVPIVSQISTAEPHAARVFIQWVDGAWSLYYWIRDDGVPSRIEPVPIDQIQGMGLSISAAVRAQIE